jgi:hypothetical protein
VVDTIETPQAEIYPTLYGNRQGPEMKTPDRVCDPASA